MSKVHDAYPKKHLYFTEQMVTGSVEGRPTINVGRQVARLVIGATRNWSRNVILWNLAADPKNEPHTNDGGCPMCQGAITIDGNAVSRNVAYYTVAHASRFVRPGAVRIESSEVAGLATAAFKLPGGKTALLVVNTGTAEQEFAVQSGGRTLAGKLMAGATGTFVW